VVIFILRRWKDTRTGVERDAPFKPTGSETIESIVHVMPLIKVYLTKSASELFDVCDQLLKRIDLGWVNAQAILGTSSDILLVLFVVTCHFIAH